MLPMMMEEEEEGEDQDADYEGGGGSMEKGGDVSGRIKNKKHKQKQIVLS